MDFVTDRNPTQSAIYLVDRGMQGKYYRYYNAETDGWSLCGSTLDEATTFKDRSSPVGFFPWVGPLTGPNYVTETNKQPKAKPERMKVAKAKPAKAKGVVAKLVVTTVGNTRVGSIVKGTKTVHPDGTVFYRDDRKKWVAMWAGKQEAARPTAEACLAFLKKKYNVEGVVL